MSLKQVRSRFFDFFVNRKHQAVESSSLIPAQDPTLLFANAGMNQFKDLFLGLEKRGYTRAVSIQKCVRAGGKHNDLDNVGFTKRHLTFFEMMGNFSFGDYFKHDAIVYAWDFLTKELCLPAEKLHATVFESDDESFNIWHTVVGLPKEKIHRLGADTNFWQMGDVGPCGPCTEIFIDRGLLYGGQNDTPATDSERFLEIWNVVFMQYERQVNGDLKPLKQTGVDTGMGLERLALVLQNKDSVFETELFASIMKKIESLTGLCYATESVENKAAFNVLADHIRSSTFLIADGCAPSNEGRGYVLRKIIRRAALFAQKLTNKNIFPELSEAVITDFSVVYPELTLNKDLIYKVLLSETEKFSVNLSRGMILLEQIFQKEAATKSISGLQAFKLYDTYGFPVELVVAQARQRGYTVDSVGFEQEMEKQKEQSGGKHKDLLDALADESISSEFTGYQELETRSEIIALIQDNQYVQSVAQGQECYVIARKSPFFIVGGGQVPDQGWITCQNIQAALLEVRYIGGAIAARIMTPCCLKVGDIVTSKVDPLWRSNAMKNHTATHMLQAALIELFGNQIKQSGSLVHPDYLRFDFTYHENVKPEDIVKIENLVNEKILDNIPVTVDYMTLKEATQKGALAFFGDKYKPDNVRMVCIDDFSLELCGGTHVHATGDIGLFKIVEVTSLSAGHRRIVAVTGRGALALFQTTFSDLKTLSVEFKSKPDEVVGAVHKQKDQLKKASLEIKQLKQKVALSLIPELLQKIELVHEIPFLYTHIEHVAQSDLQDIVTHLMQQKEGFYFLTSCVENSQYIFVCSLSECYASLNLKLFMEWAKQQYGLRGGIQKNSAQGGGVGLNQALLSEGIKGWISRNS